MKLKKMFIQNFRGYKDKTEITFEEITSLIGKNDAGKSTILEALDIFFNESKGSVKFDKNDVNVCSGCEYATVEIIFENLPKRLIVDSSVETSLKEEYLLDKNGDLHIKKVFKSSKVITSLITNYPNIKDIMNIHSMKISELKKLADKLGIENVDKRVSSELRKSIIATYDIGEMISHEIVIKSDGGKSIWDSLQTYIPIYSLFQTDRKNEDKDSEVQDPMNAAIKEIMESEEIFELRNKIFEKVKNATEGVAQMTLDKLSEMNKDLAKDLSPIFEEPKWSSIFKCGLVSDLKIPINKRGSGVRRLILLNFFRAKVEMLKEKTRNKDVIYAFEEPETGLHPDQQKMLIESFLELSNNDNVQIIFTTHSPEIAKMVPTKSLRLVQRDDEGSVIDKPSDDIIDRIVTTLGVFPDIKLRELDMDRVKVALCVEGKNDIEFLKRINEIDEFKNIIDINGAEVVILPLGGSTLKFWINNQYLSKLKLAQVHIYDSDKGSTSEHKYEKEIEDINKADRSTGIETNLREMENYIPYKVIETHSGFHFEETVRKGWEKVSVPSVYAEYNHNNSASPKKWSDLKTDKKNTKVGKAKNILNTEIINLVTKKDLVDNGTYNEIKTWFEAIAKYTKE
ncbi:MAG: AAA family ATPase [Clostridium sp.]